MRKALSPCRWRAWHSPTRNVASLTAFLASLPISFMSRWHLPRLVVMFVFALSIFCWALDIVESTFWPASVPAVVRGRTRLAWLPQKTAAITVATLSGRKL